MKIPYYRLLFLGLFTLLFSYPYAQNLDDQILQVEASLRTLEQRKVELQDEMEVLKLARVRRDLEANGLPALEEGEQVIRHLAMNIVYSESHEQAKWVAHVITPDVIKGNVSRTNDFRRDPKITTGSAKEADYFLKYLQADSSYKYDGFGYDRGHLAPSADFRWSQQALSESYFYSNMSPQAPKFNRGRWAELEGLLRAYIARNPQTQLYVVTGPVLQDDLPKVERSLNKLSLPEQYFKVVLDLDQQRAIAFLMPNKECFSPIETYAVSVDKIEEVTGIDFFASLEDAMETEVEKQINPKIWLPEAQQSDAMPIRAELLPKRTYNTIQARLFAGTGDKVKVCGTVVSTKLTRSGHTFLNLDKKFPNQIFTVAIWKDYKTNFSYQPHIELENQQVCFEGEIRMKDGVPLMEIQHERVVSMLNEK